MRIKSGKNIIDQSSNKIDYKNTPSISLPASPSTRPINLQFCFAPKFINYNR